MHDNELSYLICELKEKNIGMNQLFIHSVYLVIDVFHIFILCNVCTPITSLNYSCRNV